MKDSKLFGVELDSITGRIAQQLYQQNSIAVQGFEDTELPDSFLTLPSATSRSAAIPSTTSGMTSTIS